MAKDWTSLRVQKTTLVRIRKERARLLGEYGIGMRELPDDQAEGVSVDFCLNLLLDQAEAHRKRARQQHEKNKAKKASAGKQEEAPPDLSETV